MTELQSKLEALARQSATSAAEAIHLNEYLEVVAAHPCVAASAPERVHDMIARAGFSTDGEIRSASFFADEIFDLERPIDQLAGYFDSAAQGHETRRERAVPQIRTVHGIAVVDPGHHQLVPCLLYTSDAADE